MNYPLTTKKFVEVKLKSQPAFKLTDIYNVLGKKDMMILSYVMFYLRQGNVYLRGIGGGTWSKRLK